MTQAEYNRYQQQLRRLPAQLAAARLKVKHLEMQAERMGIGHLVHPAAQV